ncbi:aspartate aminotransferase-like enzyme [Paenibacillus sp. PvR052]|nr:aspartate aminotransferase-like enzyme [Paenibacillus sp. PvP091]MBP1170443.1 aspartate aminotransferase-like enzyme [Paenibacillus sp. PvR098]MBP2441471.1 aspartate aminotransferase-like enzyme [Paenibacillus sp. PvP052]
MLFIVDAVATIGGTEVRIDEWKINAAIGGTQKCLSVPSGITPITYIEARGIVYHKSKTWFTGHPFHRGCFFILHEKVLICSTWM